MAAVYRWWRSESLSRATTLLSTLVQALATRIDKQLAALHESRLALRNGNGVGHAALSTRADLRPMVGVTRGRKDALVIKIVGEAERARGIITLIQSFNRAKEGIIG